MSVLKNNRGTSELEFYHTAIKLRKEITQNLLRDFGVKDRDAVKSKNFPDDELRVKIVQEYPKMELFFNKYTRMQEEIRTRDVVSEYPYWLVFRFSYELVVGISERQQHHQLLQCQQQRQCQQQQRIQLVWRSPWIL